MTLRIAHENDASGIAAIVHAMPELRAVATGTIEATAEKITRNLRQAAATGTSTVYVAEFGGGVAGYCAVHWVPFLFLGGGEAYVTELFVHPAESGRGIGSGLLASVVDEARRRGCERISLLNGRKGEAYRRGFYAKRGWTERDHMANFVLALSTTVPEPACPP